MSYPDAHGSRTVTIEAALQSAQQYENGWRRAWAHPDDRRPWLRPLPGRHRPTTEIPPLGLMPHRRRRRPPFIDSPADIDAVMAQARSSIVSPPRATTYHTLIRPLAANGIRIGEAIKLDRLMSTGHKACC